MAQFSFPRDDQMLFASNEVVTSRFDEDESILMSCLIYKYNKRQVRQQRTILVTSKAIYNIDKFGFFANLISFFKSSFLIRRKIKIEDVTAITISETSDEFVIHVASEYDYRYSSNQREKILKVISESYQSKVLKPILPHFYKDNSNLHEFMTTEDDKKQGISRIPKDSSRGNEIRISEEDNQDWRDKRVALDDFELLRVLAGSRNKEIMKKDTKKVYWYVSIYKEKSKKNKSCTQFILENSSCPFLTTVEFLLETPEKYFFITKFMRGGALSNFLNLGKRFDELRTKFYVAKIILGLEYLHNMGVVYRGLSLDHVLMDEDGHICLSDFEMSKRLEPGQRTRSLVGVPEYLAPEVTKEQEYGLCSDWWALGVLVYEMIVGKSPFYDKEKDSVEQMMKNAQENDVIFPKNMIFNEDLKDFILKLLQKDPTDRLGNNGAEDVKKHKWLSDVDWELFSHKKIVPPFKPEAKSFKDFDDEFVNFGN